jgi:hypothetical protein
VIYGDLNEFQIACQDFCTLRNNVPLSHCSGENMARTLRISGRGVSDCRDRGEKILDNPEIISEYLT